MSLWASARAERVAPPLANGVIIEQPYMIVVARKR